DLPLKIAELGLLHRYEPSGAVSGLERVRAMSLNDAHIFSPTKTSNKSGGQDKVTGLTLIVK
ncbi:MAG: aminoacyl--tRNA ligase-related protein, partial [Candidatus Phytoplasma australasiaticum]|nr:aminoacyl--tRNA ligase-related protein [Candidatus Phytoplasma australasiaticum]